MTDKLHGALDKLLLAIAVVAVAALAFAQYSALPFEAPVKYGASLPASGAYPGQEFRVVSGNPPTIVSWVWDPSDSDWERTDLKAGFEDAAVFDGALTVTGATTLGAGTALGTPVLTTPEISGVATWSSGTGSDYTSRLKMVDTSGIEWTGSTTEGQLIASSRVYASDSAGGGYIVTLETNGGAGGEVTFATGADLAVVGAAQTVAPTSDVVEIGAGAAADVTIITAGHGRGQRLTFICKDANVTFTDGGAAGAAGTINTAGSFTCSEDDTISFAYNSSPGANNARWVETSRSVN